LRIFEKDPEYQVIGWHGNRFRQQPISRVRFRLEPGTVVPIESRSCANCIREIRTAAFTFGLLVGPVIYTLFLCDMDAHVSSLTNE
jgi:hypothetical protein